MHHQQLTKKLNFLHALYYIQPLRDEFFVILASSMRGGKLGALLLTAGKTTNKNLVMTSCTKIYEILHASRKSLQFLLLLEANKSFKRIHFIKIKNFYFF